MTMRFMMMHKNDPHTEAGGRPSRELIESMGKFIGEHVKAGAFVDGAGLGGSATRTRVTFRGGACTVKHGPYAGVNELIASFSVLKVRSRDEALAWARRYAEVLGDGEIELGPVNEPWDLGLIPKPENAPLRVLMLHKADGTSEAGESPSAARRAGLTKLAKEMTEAGVLLSSETLQPSAKGKRLLFARNELHVMDGPFSESKELIGGFSILRLPSIDDVVVQSKRYAAILGGTLELDIRPLYEPGDVP
ncbi:YciI family protein [Pendulispora albinea]|uniref:YciI family protein n=1 Tax=Pendulispora albinea TaxID=2741071 RepID=A0ABZ2M6Z0_9BACT